MNDKTYVEKIKSGDSTKIKSGDSTLGYYVIVWACGYPPKRVLSVIRAGQIVPYPPLGKGKAQRKVTKSYREKLIN